MTVASNIRKLASISQHSSISQADDVSSPYARVKSMTNHAYDKLRNAEHPYAQVSAVGSSTTAAATAAASAASTSAFSNQALPPNGGGNASQHHHHHANVQPSAGGASSMNSTMAPPPPPPLSQSSGDDAPSRRGSSESLLGGGNAPAASHENIAAASAIAGRVSASQELPYMTPPIVQQHQQQPHQHPQPTQHFSGDSQDSSSERPPTIN